MLSWPVTHRNVPNIKLFSATHDVRTMAIFTILADTFTFSRCHIISNGQRLSDIFSVLSPDTPELLSYIDASAPAFTARLSEAVAISSISGNPPSVPTSSLCPTGSPPNSAPSASI
jgi:hypothetical protein